MPSVLESGMLRLTPEEVETYHDAARWMHKVWDMPLDLTQPIRDMDWYNLGFAKAAMAGDLQPLRDHATRERQRCAHSCPVYRFAFFDELRRPLWIVS